MINDYKSEFCAGKEISECEDMGTGWALAFRVNSIVLLLLAVNFLIFSVGAFNFYARLCAGCMNMFMCPVHMASIVIIIVYRFGQLGKIASHCEDPTVYNGADEEMSDAWTYEKDSNLLFIVLVFQTMTFLPICCLGSLPLRNGRKKASDLL